MSIARIDTVASLTFDNLGVLHADPDDPLMSIPTNGVYGVVPEGFILDTNSEHSLVDLTVEYHEATPDITTTGWEAVSEFSIVFGANPYELFGWRWSDDRLDRLNFDGAGEYRVRVHVRGRWDYRTEANEDLDAPLEFWLLQLWVAAPAPATFLVDDVRREPEGQ